MSKDIDPVGLVQRLDIAVRAFERAKGSTRRSLGVVVGERLGAVEAERDACVAWMDKKESWFAGNADHPKFDERTDAWIGKLREYEALSDAIGRAASIPGSEAARAA